MKLRICGYTGCNNLTEGEYYCIKHKSLMDKKKRDRQLFTQRGSSGEYNNLYRSSRWRALRKQFLREHPICYICGAPASIVDHIYAHKGNLELFFNEQNLQPLCQSCHSAKTLRENNNFNRMR